MQCKGNTHRNKRFLLNGTRKKHSKHPHGYEKIFINDMKAQNGEINNDTNNSKTNNTEKQANWKNETGGHKNMESRRKASRGSWSGGVDSVEDSAEMERDSCGDTKGTRVRRVGVTWEGKGGVETGAQSTHTHRAIKILTGPILWNEHDYSPLYAPFMGVFGGGGFFWG